MRAVVLRTEERIDVVGFVHYAGQLWAVYRDDEGRIDTIPTEAIRLEPRVITTSTPVDVA